MSALNVPFRPVCVKECRPQHCSLVVSSILPNSLQFAQRRAKAEVRSSRSFSASSGSDLIALILSAMSQPLVKKDDDHDDEGSLLVSPLVLDLI